MFTIKKSQRGYTVNALRKPQQLPSGQFVTPSTIYAECPCREFASHIAEALNAMDERKKQCQTN